jgi:hypothetical protein
MSAHFYRRQNYPLAPTGAQSGSRTGKRKATGVIKSSGRGAVATPQSLITLVAITNKNEHKRRKLASRPGDLKSMYAAPSNDETDFSIKRGMLGLCRIMPDSSFRSALTNDSSVEVVTNMAGLSRDEQLGMPCVVQVARDSNDVNSDDHTTIVIQGVQT